MSKVKAQLWMEIQNKDVHPSTVGHTPGGPIGDVSCHGNSLGEIFREKVAFLGVQ